MFKEFKEFILTGNVIEFAVAVIMAGAIGAVINGFVNDIVMPFIGYITGGTDFSNMFHVMGGATYPTLEAARAAGESVIAYGAWFNTIINLILVGFVMFLLVRAYNRTRKKEAAGPTVEELLTEIRDSLKK